MADPLSSLRQFHTRKKEIIERNGMICFGEYCWSKQTKTNYLIYSSSRDGPNRNYYTLECLVYFLKNVNLPHPTYVKQAASLEIPVVQRPDRKDLLAYLSGETSTSASIDKSAPIELPISISQLNKDVGQSSNNLSHNLLSANDQDGPSNKLARLDEMEKVRKQFAARLDAPKIKKPLAADLLTRNSNVDSNTTSLRDSMSNEQIAALKAKRLARKRCTIIDADTDLENNQGIIGNNNTAAVHSVLLQYDSNFTKEIQNKERVWRNRSNILQSSGKNFQKSVFYILQSIKTREESALRNRNSQVQTNSMVPNRNTIPVNNQPNNTQSASQQYNRYDQERFAKNDSALGFSIDTTSTYHGLTLKSVTEGSTNKVSSNNSANQPQTKHSSEVNKPQKRVSRTPIIIIPATNTSLITMFNCKAILQDLKYIDSKSCEQRRENEILIQRRKPNNTTVPYRIIDNPLKLTPDEWNRVVAVFVQGPTWQFKGWPWNGNPVEIFARIKAFHLKFDEMKLDNNVSKWSVEIIDLSRNKRHLDRANLLKFWSLLDQHIAKHKHNVVRY
ncbi:hypothetical protein SSS_03276 [Sarcoptes scabiei]|uniref:Parafibromin n=1 Tax=Sarcoptes scabiei TaxID=52283 RepID=A0A834VH02_SARSC|nr:hypothetical protein SSS_03276 [Sarcoptes scabiei]